MSLLTRYLLRQNLFLLVTILLTGTGIYILADLFERLDVFWEAEIPFSGILGFYVLKIPLIISQLLPAVFLLSLVIQMNLLDRTRELIALYAGGISPMALIRFILIYGVLWALGQFFFSQVLGVTGDRIASDFWKSEVKGTNLDEMAIRGRWITDKNRIIHIGEAIPAQQRGANLLVYTLGESGVTIEEVLRAKAFTIKDRSWELEDVVRLLPATFGKEEFSSYSLPIRQDLKAFQIFEKAGMKPEQLPFWELQKTIRRLEKSGSNVEALRTTWHTKLSYAASMVIMGLLALIVSQLTPNIYKGVGISLLLVFLFYSLTTLCTSMGEKGIISPVLGAWFADSCIFFISIVWLFLPLIRSKRQAGLSG